MEDIKLFWKELPKKWKILGGAAVVIVIMLIVGVI